jgi:hypothetical protein
MAVAPVEAPAVHEDDEDMEEKEEEAGEDLECVQVTAAAPKCKCGSTTHLRNSHRDCPLSTKRSSGGGAMASSGRAKKTKVTDDAEGFVSQPEADEYDLEWDTEATDRVLEPRFASHIKDVNRKMRSLASLLPGGESVCNGDDGASDRRVVVFRLVAREFLATMRTWMDMQLLGLKQRVTRPSEFWAFLASFIGTSLIGAGAGGNLELLNNTAKARDPGVAPVLLSLERFKQLANAVTGIDPEALAAAQAAASGWCPATDVIKLVRSMEEAAYRNVKRLAVTRHLTIVLDDELIANRSLSNQSVMINARKAGKEGIKNDAVADAFARLFLHGRHKERLGYTQHEAVRELLDELGSELDGVLSTFDRGYAGMWLCKLLALRRVAFIMVCNKSAHPHKLQSELGAKATQGAAHLAIATKDEAEALRLQTSTAAKADALAQAHGAADHAAIAARTIAHLAMAAATKATKKRERAAAAAAAAAAVAGAAEWPSDAALESMATEDIAEDVTENVTDPSVAVVHTETDELADGVFAVRLDDGVQLDDAENQDNSEDFEDNADAAWQVGGSAAAAAAAPEEPPPPEDQEPRVVRPGASGGSLLVDDAPMLGRAIYSAERNLPWGEVTGESAGHTMRLTAIAFRDYNNAKNTQSNVVRLLLAGNMFDAKKFAGTMCMERAPLPHTVKPEGVLYYPQLSHVVSVTAAMARRLAMEATLNALKASRPLTCWQREALWFILRLFIVTGTAGGAIAALDQEALKLLSETPRAVPQATNEQVAAILMSGWVFARGTSTPSMRSGVINEAKVIEWLRQQPWVAEYYEAGLFESVTHSCVGVSPDGIALVSETLAAGGAQVIANVEIKSKVVVGTASAADKVAYSMSVVHVSPCSQQILTLAFSLPPAATVPGGLGYGRLFHCVVGDATWWLAVPREHRGQVIQGAAVLGLDYTLYVVADVGKFMYACLCKVSAAQRRKYLDAIQKWHTLMDWALDSVLVSGPPPAAHNAFTPATRYVLGTHLRVWRAVRKLVHKNKGPILPARVFKTLGQVIYNKLKGGINGSTQYVQVLSASQPVPFHDVHKMLAFRALKHATINAFILWRIHLVSLKTWSTIQGFRNHANAQGPLSAFCLELSVELFQYAKHLADSEFTVQQVAAAAAGATGANARTYGGHERMTDEQIASVLDSRPAPGAKWKSVISYWATGLPAQFRQEQQPTGQHTCAVTAARRRCPQCCDQTSTECAQCGVTMHTQKSNNLCKTCWEKWHDPVAPLVREQRQDRDAD